jgi:transcriptional regulator with XRE-family HTH domain
MSTENVSTKPSRQAQAQARPDRLTAEPGRCDNAKHDEDPQSDSLHDQKWRVGQRRSHRFQARHLLESLRDQNEDIEIQGNHLLSTARCPPLTAQFPLRLTALDSSAYSPFRDPTPPSDLPDRIAVFETEGARRFIKDRFRFMARGNFGDRLKRERELREVSIEELTKATRISARFVEALENEDWGRLPGGVFGHGFVRTIARYLGLNEEAFLGEYDLARADHLAAAPPKPEERIPSPPTWLPVVALFLLLILVTGLFYSARYGLHRYAAYRATKKSAAASLSMQPRPQLGSASPGSAEQSSSAALLDLSVSTSAATRVRILADNKLLLDAELPAGETRHFSASRQFEVTAGDSSAVLLELNGKAMPPLGAPGSSGTMVLTHKDLRP